MPSLDRTLRRDLENAVKKARRAAEAGAKKALEALAVHHHEPWPNLSLEERALRNRLRAHGRQLGDALDKTRGTQGIKRLTGECAYEHWHRMLFARFLAENDLLIESEHGVAITLDECQELAREQGADWLELASSYAVRMLREIFRPDDPVLDVSLPPETSSALEDLLKDLPAEVFTAGDSLGWCYQFWQAERKDEVNASGNKIGADELPAVTQLFTEDYMVDFLLDNTLGAWHAGKLLAANPALAQTAQSEEELRNAVALPGCPWKYLRFIKAEEGKWTPAAGTFEGWPKTAKELTCLDPCMGSGHFVVAMFERLVALRMAEEGVTESEVVKAVIRDNLFGLEIDPRCTQIAAFNLALAAWRRVGYCPLPPMNLACSGLAPNTREADWLAIAGDDEKLRNGMVRIYRLFQDAPVLGSLINPRLSEGDLLVAAFHELRPLLEEALAHEAKDDTSNEMAATARGVTKAADILASQFTLVATNVPYLGRGNQGDVLQDYCERVHPEAKSDLATCFAERCLDFCSGGGSTSLVTPQNWFSQPRYEKLRTRLLTSNHWHGVARLGSGAFETIGGQVVTVSLVMLSNITVVRNWLFMALDLSDQQTVADKSAGLAERYVAEISQASQLKNPNAIITLDSSGGKRLLNELARAWQGLVTGDDNRFYGLFWERGQLDGKVWLPVQQAPQTSLPFTGRETVARWENANGDLHLRSKAHNFPPASTLGKTGIAIQRMASLNATIFSGNVFDDSVAPLIPDKQANLPAIYAFCLSDEFKEAVRRINHQPKVIPGALTKVPFDLSYWQKITAEKYPHGLPKPFSSDPTQWLFNGRPKGSDLPLQVAMARLLGYQWPRLTGSSFPDCPALGPDGLESFADDDGIVCLLPVHGEQPAAARLRSLLATAFGSDWSAGKERELLAATGSKKTTLEDWLVDEFFEQHCNTFRQRPFIWHLWDGLRDGFNVLVNYHRLAEGRSGILPLSEEQDNAAGSRVYSGHRLLEKLIYSYLGDWITRQRQDQQNGVEGADARLAAALHLREELKKILAGEAPYDLFVRWKPLHQQAIGWEPDINDGVRMNIRPFLTARPLNVRGKNTCILRTTPKIKWDKDRGKEPQRPREDYPWFWGWDEKTQDFAGGKTFDGVRWNDLHYSNAFKQAARATRNQT